MCVAVYVCVPYLPRSLCCGFEVESDPRQLEPQEGKREAFSQWYHILNPGGVQPTTQTTTQVSRNTHTHAHAHAHGVHVPCAAV